MHILDLFILITLWLLKGFQSYKTVSSVLIKVAMITSIVNINLSLLYQLHKHFLHDMRKNEWYSPNIYAFKLTQNVQVPNALLIKIMGKPCILPLSLLVYSLRPRVLSPLKQGSYLPWWGPSRDTTFVPLSFCGLWEQPGAGTPPFWWLSCGIWGQCLL